ncbi:MAG TPA: phenylalanine--tRNA ligase subunit alpha [Gemmatimonadales bacterium]|jgi:phenylalanyl-tRNA synthetase alpha chain|nr:phenylalanine--tRNA ligase subunit alpha [Gemmatimonadales bacterium]
MTTGYADLDALLPRLEAVPRLGPEALEAEAVAVLGRKSGILTAALKRLATLPIDERKRFGAAVNQLKVRFETAFAQRRATVEAERHRRETAGLDLTMPGRSRWVGASHPVTQVVDEIVEIFRGIGFTVAIGPEVETEWYNFLALNFPPDHPAMDMHDTLYLDAPPVEGEPDGRLLLRTHTSPVQIRTLLASPPPVRVVIPGMVYRNDAFDASHSPAFSQIEGLAVDEGISFVDLKATLIHFARSFFSATTRTRFRPSFFPFTEPSAEMDVECQLCHGSGCPACKGTGWMEILGCGMVHPTVLESCSLDSERYTGWAFGMGPHRIAMLRYRLPDIRLLLEGDMRFLQQVARRGETS